MFRVADIDYSPPVTTLGLQSSIIASNAADAGAPYAQDLAVDAQLIVEGANNLVLPSRSGFETLEDQLPPRVPDDEGYPPLIYERQFVPPKDMVREPGR